MENFIVSARKYRPATFASVVGQSHITSTLRNAISRHQLAHAYLFCGPRGVGKTTCARIFAKAINCMNPGPDAEACNECESCRAFNEGRSFNIHELDAASNNSVDDIRSLTDQVRILPQVGRYSVYIIDEVHMLSAAAFNAFLKTLEEPPAHAVFILATTEKHKIIPTILSRCQIYDFNRIRVEDGVNYLKYIAQQEGVSYDDASLHIIAQKADGGMRDALSMFDKVVSFCGSKLSAAEVAATLNVLDYDTYFSITDHLLAGDYTAALLLFDEVLRKGFSCGTFVGGLNTHFRDLLMCKNPQTLPLLEVSGSVAERYRQQAEHASVPLLFEGINLLTAVDGSLRAATNQRLHVELSLMKLCGLGQKKNNDTLTPTLPDLVRRDETPSKQERPGAVRAVASATVVVAEEVSQPSTPSTPVTSAVQPERNTASSSPSSPPTHTLRSRVEVPEVQPSSNGSVAPLSGRSILSLLQQTPPPTEGEAEEETGEEETDCAGEMVDGETLASRLEEGCLKLSQSLLREHPRLGIVFQEAQVCNHQIQLRVPNASLYDEVMNHLTDLQKQLCDLSGVPGPVEFRVEMAQTQADLKPIKVEDRMRFLREKNPLIVKLCQELDLDIE
ncbi:MAG: DNA polymerase III subunit gamma/tau [Alistipes sp.]|nr:DNA polymerase III subunit gamma/tau [Alistipes sp.]